MRSLAAVDVDDGEGCLVGVLVLVDLLGEVAD